MTTNAIYPTARSLLNERFRQPSLATQKKIWSLIERSQAVRTDPPSATAEPANDAQIEVRVWMVRSLAAADWQALTRTRLQTLEQHLSTQQAKLSRSESVVQPD